jgi:hypothetical protein
MPKTPTGHKKPKSRMAIASKKLPRKLPDDRIARGVAIMREATEKKMPRKRHK